MTQDVLSFAALICFALAALAAVAGFRIASLRHNGPQFVLVGAGLLLKTASIGLGCVTKPTHFFNSPSEVFGLFAWALAFSYLIALAVCAVRSLGALVLPLVVALLAVSMFFDKQGVNPGVPTGRLFAIHIIFAFLGYGLFLTACGASVLYLEQARLLKRKVFGVFFWDLPSLERLERLQTVCAWLGLAIFVVALGTGAVMAARAGIPFWLNPKTLAALMTVVVFAALLVGRATRWLHPRAAAQFVLAGAGLVLLTFALSHPLAPPAAKEAPAGSTSGLNGHAEREAGRAGWLQRRS